MTRLHRLLTLAAAIFGTFTLASCGSSLSPDHPGGSAAASGGAPSCTASAASSTHYVLVAGLGDNSLTRYSRNPDGTLTPLDCPPFAAAPGLSQPTGLAFDAAANLLYVANYTSNTVAGFQFNPNSGSVTPSPGSPFASGITPWAVAIDPQNRFLYAATAGSSPSQSIAGYAIGAGGSLTPIPVQASPNGDAFALAMDPIAPYLYVANYLAQSSVSAYTINSTGSLTLIGDYPATGSYPRSVVVDLSGKYVYVANTDRTGDRCGPGLPAGTTISAFAIGPGGALTAIGTTKTDLAPQSLVVASAGGGEFLYSANYCSNDIAVYQIGGNGALTLAGTTQEPPQSGPHALAVSRDGFLYAVNYLSNLLNAFQIGSNGLLNPLGQYPTSGNAAAVAVTP